MESLNNVVALSLLLSVLALGSSLLGWMFVRRQCRHMSDELLSAALTAEHNCEQLHLYAEYTRRHREIMSMLPDDMSASGSDEIMPAMQLYFDLCCEEYSLWMSCHIDHDMWLFWQRSMCRNMSRPAFASAWARLRPLYDSDFAACFDNISAGSK